MTKYYAPPEIICDFLVRLFSNNLIVPPLTVCMEWGAHDIHSPNGVKFIQVRDAKIQNMLWKPSTNDNDLNTVI